MVGRPVRAALFLLLIINRQGVGSSLPDGPRIHDLSGAFLRFWSAAKDETVEKQVSRFRYEVVPQFPVFYSYKIEKWRKAGKDPDAEIVKELRDFPKIEARFGMLAKAVPEELRQSLISFLNRFPDFKTDFDVYITHSLGEMDGGTRIIDGRFYFIIGLDGMTRYHEGISTETPFFHHELFHVYHWQQGFKANRIYSNLWLEGLATFVSHALNPHASMRDIMLDYPPGLIPECQKKIRFLWDDMESKLESDSEAEYERYFLPSSTSETIPRRAGYYLGYLVAKFASKTSSLLALSRLKEQRLLDEMRFAISKLKKSGGDVSGRAE